MKYKLTNKVDQLKDIVVKLDDTFPNEQFLTPGFSKPFDLDRNWKGGRVMIYIHENIPSKLLTKHVLPSDIKQILLELNFQKCKWLLVGKYHTHL